MCGCKVCANYFGGWVLVCDVDGPYTCPGADIYDALQSSEYEDLKWLALLTYLWILSDGGKVKLVVEHK